MDTSHFFLLSYKIPIRNNAYYLCTAFALPKKKKQQKQENTTVDWQEEKH